MKGEFYDKILFEKVKQGDQSAFSLLFTAYYRDLTIFASQFTHNIEVSEEIVQDVFVRFWETREYIQITTSLKSYLIKTVQNRCLDLKRHQKVKENYSGQVQAYLSVSHHDTENYIFYTELEEQIDKAIDNLPADVAEAFRLNRFEGLTYPEIAEKKGVSVRTIEVRIGKALAILREELKDHLVTIILLVSILFC
jgi:RNA polymerase sigma-70 factor (ECF subfamily)